MVKLANLFHAGVVAESLIHKPCKSILKFAKKFLFKREKLSISKNKEKPLMQLVKVLKKNMAARKNNHKGKIHHLSHRVRFLNGSFKACN